jgi:hypothetical protein
VVDAELQSALAAGDTAAVEAARSKLSRVVGPFKTKLEKRQRNVTEVMQARVAKDLSTIEMDQAE